MSSLKKQRLSIVLPLNETKNAKIKKILKFFQNDKKKKTLLCYNAPNTYQCMDFNHY